MASKIECVKCITAQLCSSGEMRYRKMFGEYGVYCHGKIFDFICDESVIYGDFLRKQGVISQSTRGSTL